MNLTEEQIKAERDIAARLRERRVTRWVHATGETPKASGYALDAECSEAADEIEQLRAALASAAPPAAAREEEVRVLPSEAVYGFAAWLTCRPATLTVGSFHEASSMAELVGEFINANGFEPPRDGVYPENLKQPAPPQPATGSQDRAEVTNATSLYVACHECTECGHTGINDESETESACSVCAWHGPSPEKDLCPGCNRDGSMCRACPKCGGYYTTIAETHIGSGSQDRADRSVHMPGVHMKTMTAEDAQAMGQALSGRSDGEGHE
ncbi:hypothetical protein [Methylibium sp. Pch-M]|uniref:hypothetical protein n=1 Tax=Methylibium sp. Pch-M TaxID=2082386 RepID=UPI001013346B|nr:hypothetical protein [Methylibium sp. Pch-M]